MISLITIGVVSFFLAYGHLPTPVLLFLLGGWFLMSVFVKRRQKQNQGGFLSIDFHAQRSQLSQWHSGTKLIFALLFVFLSIGAAPILVPAFIFLIMTFFTVGLGKIPWSYYLSLLMIPATFLALSILTVVLELTPHPMGVLSLPVGSKFLSVTPENQLRGLTLLVRSLGAVSALYFLSLSTPMSHLIHSLSRLHLPEVFISLLYLMYRYIFILLETFYAMTVASASRLGYKNRITSLKTMVYTSANLFFISLRKASDNFSGIESRCFQGEVRFLVEPTQRNKKEVLLLSSGFGAALLLWIGLGGVYG